MRQQTQSLSPMEIACVSAMIRHCETVDQASPYIQMDHSLNADQDMDSWFLEWEGDTLIAAASIFAPSREEAEVALCVRPVHRGKGLGTALLTQAFHYLMARGVQTVLLVCHNASETGRRFATRHSQTLQHTEYDLRLARPFHGMPAQRLEVRETGLDDFPIVKAVCQGAYGEEDRDFDSFLTHSMSLPNKQGFLGLLDGVPAAVCFLGMEDDAFSFNTVAVHPSLQGRGLGREFLSALLHRMEGKASHAEISVDSTNQAAYSLYRKLGFEEVRTIAYHVVSVPNISDHTKSGSR